MKQQFIIHTFQLGSLQTNCYIVLDTLSKEAIIIDPADLGSFIAEKITGFSLIPKAIVLTHGHFDHVLGAFELQHIFNIPCFMNTNDQFLIKDMNSSASYHLQRKIIEPPPETTALPNGTLDVCSIPLTVISSPGHTPGGICLEITGNDVLFTGDTLFANGYVGRTDLSYSNRTVLHESIRNILSCQGSTILYPGHGEPTTVEIERTIHKLQGDV